MRSSDQMGWRGVARMRVLALVAAAAVALTGAFTPPALTTALAGDRRQGETVATGLDNPRGLVFLDERTLAVGEAGHAGNVCPGPGLCMGLNGQVTRVRLGDRERRVLSSGLPSFSGPFGAFGIGGVTVQDGELYFVVGLNPQSFRTPAETCQGVADFSACAALVRAFVDQTGFLNRVRSLDSDRGWHNVAGVGRFDFDYTATFGGKLSPGNPEFAPGDADPFGLTPGPSGGLYVVDAASNTLDFVSDGRHGINVLTYITDPPTHQPIFDAAPTCATRAPNGDVYIGTESNTLRRWNGRELATVLTGGKIGQVVGCTADRHGNIYVANLTSEIRGTFPDFNEKPFDGSIVKVSPRLTTSYVVTGLNYPTGLTLGPDGDLYVAVNGLCPKDLSLLNADNSPSGACPEPGKVVRIAVDTDD